MLGSSGWPAEAPRTVPEAILDRLGPARAGQERSRAVPDAFRTALGRLPRRPRSVPERPGAPNGRIFAFFRRFGTDFGRSERDFRSILRRKKHRRIRVGGARRHIVRSHLVRPPFDAIMQVHLVSIRRFRQESPEVPAPAALNIAQHALLSRFLRRSQPQKNFAVSPEVLRALLIARKSRFGARTRRPDGPRDRFWDRKWCPGVTFSLRAGAPCVLRPKSTKHCTG